MADDNPLDALPNRHVTAGVISSLVVTGRKPDGTQVVMLHVWHSTGHSVFPMMPEYAKSMANELFAAAGGVVVASTVPPSARPNREIRRSQPRGG